MLFFVVDENVDVIDGICLQDFVLRYFVIRDLSFRAYVLRAFSQSCVQLACAISAAGFRHPSVSTIELLPVECREYIVLPLV